MARAKRHYIPGQIWHLTHRCHKREFLLKFSKDRYRWLQWLCKFESVDQGSDAYDLKDPYHCEQIVRNLTVPQFSGYHILFYADTAIQL